MDESSTARCKRSSRSSSPGLSSESWCAAEEVTNDDSREM